MIWCVEDKVSIRDIEVYTLQSTGFEARSFENGNTFWQELQKEKPGHGRGMKYKDEIHCPEEEPVYRFHNKIRVLRRRNQGNFISEKRSSRRDTVYNKAETTLSLTSGAFC